ncbi:MAG: sugar ABC transporter permease [Phycisphaerales bacterium]|nr:sugar ABC transporter permease [Phycisphaerales bacterium]
MPATARRHPDLRPTLRGLAWTSPFLLGTLLFLVVPAAMSFSFSLTDYSLIEPPLSVGLGNYREMLGDPLFWRVVRNTAFFALGSVLLGTPMAIALAALVETRARGSALVRAVIFFPTLVPIVAASIGWMWLYAGEHGLINRLLGRVGIHDAPDWLNDTRTAMPALIVMSLWFIGSPVVIYGAAMRDVPRTLFEAADLDGMGPLTRFRNVTLPMISPAVLFNVVVSVIWALQVFAVPAIMTKGGPNEATNVYALYVYRTAFDYGRMGYASALAWVQLLLTLVLALIVVLGSRRFVFYRN